MLQSLASGNTLPDFRNLHYTGQAAFYLSRNICSAEVRFQIEIILYLFGSRHAAHSGLISEIASALSTDVTVDIRAHTSG